MNEKRIFTIPECVFAWLSLAAAYLFWRFFPASEAPLGCFLLVLMIFVSTAVISKIKGARFHAVPVSVGISAIVISASLIICANSFMYFFAYCYVIAAYCYFVFALNGNVTKKGFNDLILVDFIKALFILPFCSFGYLFRGLFSRGNRKNGKAILKILLGIAIALIPTGIVISLLSYDEGFRTILNQVFRFKFTFSDILKIIMRLSLAIPTGMYIYGLFISATDNKCSRVLTEDICNRVSQKVKILPAATALTAVIPLFVIYIIFFISQWNYYISGFTGNLPDGLSYAEYAREGFFQLCAVSVINLIIIIIAMIFMQQKNTFGKGMLKAISVTYSIITLILISTALSKMLMYIDYYGLTQKRVYSTWFMIVLAFIFILLIIRQFVPTFKIAAASFTVCIIMFAGLSVVNADALIAKYNVNCYLDGKLDDVDIDALIELGDSSVPELVKLAQTLEERTEADTASRKDITLHKKVVKELEAIAHLYNDEDKEFYTYTIPYIRAKQAMEELNCGLTM